MCTSACAPLQRPQPRRIQYQSQCPSPISFAGPPRPKKTSETQAPSCEPQAHGEQRKSERRAAKHSPEPCCPAYHLPVALPTGSADHHLLITNTF